MFEIIEKKSFIEQCLECFHNLKNHACHKNSKDSDDKHFKVQWSEESFENSVWSGALTNTTMLLSLGMIL